MISYDSHVIQKSAWMISHDSNVNLHSNHGLSHEKAMIMDEKLRLSHGGQPMPCRREKLLARELKFTSCQSMIFLFLFGFM